MRIFIDITSDQGGGNFVPATVQNLQASLLSDTIQVSWDEFIVSNEDRDGEVSMYRIERKVNEGAWQLNREFEEEDWATGFFIYDIDIEEGNTYYYRIKALTTKGKETDWSNEVFVEVEEEIIFNPPSLSLELKPTGIQVTWVVDSNNTIPTTNNQSEVIKDSEAPTFGNLAAGSDTALYSTVVEGSTYKFRIRAYNEDHGYSEWSDQKTIVFNPASTYDRIEQHTYTSATSNYNGQTVGVEFYFAEDFRNNPRNGFPWVLWFHGAGENGNADFAKLGSASGYPRHTRVNNNDVPYNVVSIQCPGQNWTDEFLQEGIAFAVSVCPYFDSDKFMISGWSQGGVPVYAMLSSTLWRSKIAAAVAFSAVAGVTAENRCPSIADRKGVWIIVANDDSYGTGAHTAYYAGLKACPNFNPEWHRRTLYTSGGHDCVNRTLTGSGGSVVDAGDDTVISGGNFHQWMVDRYDFVAPSAPSNVAVVSKSSNSITIGWDASTDDGSGVIGYIVAIDDIEQVITTNTEFTVFDLDPETEYGLKVKAVDNNGNESLYSSVLNVTTDAEPTYVLEETYKASFHGNASAESAGWTLMESSGVANASYSKNINNEGATKTITITSQKAWWQAVAAEPSTGDESGIYIDIVLRTAWRARDSDMNASGNKCFKISGLDPARRYDFDILCNTSSTGVNNRLIVTDALGDQTIDRLISNQTLTDESCLVKFAKKTPNSSGEIELDLKILGPAQLIYINAIVTREYSL